MDLTVLGFWLDLMILEMFSNLKRLYILDLEGLM